jgi:hypothetical protein
MIVQNGDAHVEAINKGFSKVLFDYSEDRSEKTLVACLILWTFGKGRWRLWIPAWALALALVVYANFTLNFD